MLKDKKKIISKYFIRNMSYTMYIDYVTLNVFDTVESQWI